MCGLTGLVPRLNWESGTRSVTCTLGLCDRTMSEAAVLQALKCACSQEPAVLKVGEQQLKAWETEKGFYTSLAVSMHARECSDQGRGHSYSSATTGPVCDQKLIVTIRCC